MRTKTKTLSMCGVAGFLAIVASLALWNSPAAISSPAEAKTAAVVVSPRVVAGQTYPGGGWQTYTGTDGPGIWIQVDTTSAGFTRTPTYVTSVGGNFWHWRITGASSVYPPDATLGGDLRRGFRIYLRFSDGRAIDPVQALNSGWYVNWIGAE
ncbi:hypothetical protein [Lentzea tibetensis]|uniref:hypothetical protein n=1 Tax=Lentzea tibetensis TaxID=2591470 RepID=UPI001646F386|nr:hypothetical protein [Lentzea tibetensis]